MRLLVPFLLLISCASPASAATVTNGLVANWLLDGDTSDSVGNADGTAFGGTTFVPGQTGQGLSFDGTTGYVAIDNLFFDTAGQLASFSVSAWVNTTYTGGGNMDNWAILDFDRSDYFNVSIDGDGRFAFHTTSSGNNIDDFWSTTNGFNDGQWHHVVAVYDGTDKRIYVDGVLDATRSNAHGGNGVGIGSTRYGFLGEGSEATTFNGSNNNQRYDGALDDVALYDRALTPAEVLANFNGAPASPAVPEPSSLLLAVLAGLAAVGWRRRL